MHCARHVDREDARTVIGEHRREGAAHHLDLRASDPGDPPSVVQVRAEELEAMRGWVRQWGEAHPGPPVGPARAQGAMDGGIVTDVKK